MAKEQYEERLDFCRLARLPDHLYWINKQPKFQLVSELEAACSRRLARGVARDNNRKE